MSRLPTRKYKYFKTIREQICDKSSKRCESFVNSTFFVCQLVICPSMFLDDVLVFACDFSQANQLSNYSIRKVVTRTYHSVFFNNDVVRLAFTLSASKNLRCQEMKLIRQDRTPLFSLNVFHLGVTLCFFPAIFLSSTRTDKKNIVFFR